MCVCTHAYNKGQAAMPAYLLRAGTGRGMDMAETLRVSSLTKPVPTAQFRWLGQVSMSKPPL